MVVEIEEHNKTIVSKFYKALATKDSTTVHHLLASNIEWWFHGPLVCSHHLFRLLTGNTMDSGDYTFTFNPMSVVSFGFVVVAEGFDDIPGSNRVNWVHAWTVTDGVITQVREYFNTSVTVIRFGKAGTVHVDLGKTATCQSLWHSKLTDSTSMPGRLLAL